MGRTEDIRHVQSHLQDLFETLPAGQADVLEAVVTGTPLQVRDDDQRPTTAEETSIIIVGGRGRRWMVLDVDRVLAELDPQPLPPEPDPRREGQRGERGSVPTRPDS